MKSSTRNLGLFASISSIIIWFLWLVKINSTEGTIVSFLFIITLMLSVIAVIIDEKRGE